MIVEPQPYSRLTVWRFRLRQAIDWYLHTTLAKPMGWVIAWTGIILVQAECGRPIPVDDSRRRKVRGKQDHRPFPDRKDIAPRWRTRRGERRDHHQVHGDVCPFLLRFARAALGAIFPHHPRATIEWGRAHGNLDFLASVKQPQLNEYLNQSKVNVLVSLREGANKGLAEGLFAGTPALLIRESACGNHLHINERTGKVVPDQELEAALEWFADHHQQFTSADWATENIAPDVSARHLSEALKRLDLMEGHEWTADLLVKVNSPELRYSGRDGRT